MNQAVQAGKKTAATVYLEPNSEKARELVKALPGDCDALPYEQTMLYVFHKGRLQDFFNYEKIKSLYMNHGALVVNWDIVEELFKKELSFFGDEQSCGFSLQSGGTIEQRIITGLVLGYPVESTISFLWFAWNN